MKKLSMITIATMLVIVACFALVACNVTPNDNNGGNGDNGGDGVISAADGNGATLVIGEANLDIFQDDYAVGTATLTFDEVKANMLNLGDDMVAVYATATFGETTKYEVFNSGYYYSVFGVGEGEPYSGEVIYANMGDTTYSSENGQDWVKQENTGFDMTEDRLLGIIEMFLDGIEERMDAEETTVVFDDNSIAITLHSAEGTGYMRLKKYTNYNLTFPEAELQNIEE